MPQIETDPDVVGAFLSDAAHVPGGYAAGVAFPRTASEVSSIVAGASTILPIGAQSSLTGGATPRGEVVLSTRALTDISIDASRRLVTVGAGVPLHTLQNALSSTGLLYPPVPTFDGAFVGGTIATNAAGAATFKWGTTRDWVEGLTLALADGTILRVRRGQTLADANRFAVPLDGQTLMAPRPAYSMPEVPKLSAGYFARAGMDLVDLFVGSEGTLGVVIDATLRVTERRARCVALISCASDEDALRLTGALRQCAAKAWSGDGPLDVSAIEYMDARSLGFVSDQTFARTGIPRPASSAVLLLVQLDVVHEFDAVLDALTRVLEDEGVSSDPLVAGPGDEVASARLFELREAVPTAVNAAVGMAKQRDSEIQKTAGDFIVPFSRLAESLALYRAAFESRGLDYAVWGHVSDGNLHPNVVPQSRNDMERGREALLEIARAVIGMGGSPLAEHGVGRSPMKQQMLRELYGDAGINQMKAVKRAFDPSWKLSPGVLFDR